MEQKPPKPMTPFDCMVTPSYLHMLKLMIPYTPPHMQRFLAIFIKFLELRHTLEIFKGFPLRSPSAGLFDELKPYMEPSEREMMEQMTNMMNMMEMIQNLKAMSEATDENTSDNSGGLNAMDIMKSMMSSEQQEMFDMYSNLFDNEINTSDKDEKKGGLEHERMDE